MTDTKPLSNEDQIEIARRSGYNEACYICEKKVEKLNKEVKKTLWCIDEIYKKRVLEDIYKIFGNFTKEQENDNN